MKIVALLPDYISYRRALGYQLTGEEFALRAFCKSVRHCSASQLKPKHVLAYLQSGSVCPQTIARRRRALAGFFRYLQNRCGLYPPKLPPPPRHGASSFVPFIYSHGELKRLLQSAPTACQNPLAHIDADTLRTLILLLYGAGLRLSEATNLNVDDVDFNQAVLTVRKTKFFKMRVVPLGADLLRVLTDHRRYRDGDLVPAAGFPFFISRSGKRIRNITVERTFRQLRKIAGVGRSGSSRQQPRLHDLRHTAAVNRLIAWYRNGADIQYLLPRLATYLGHKDISGTKHYLTMVPPLLREASKKFDSYAGGRICD